MNRKAPRLSIGLPVYNGAQYLAESLEALLGQDMGDFEIIVSDNASTDGSADIADDFARRDPRIRVIRQPVNRGAAANFNFVYQKATGTYFKWACADDRAAAGFLGKAVAELEACPEAILCYGGVTLIDEAGRIIGHDEQRLDLRSLDPIERFSAARVHRGQLNVLQGVMRAEAIRRTRLMGAFPAADEALMVELSLQGTFREIGEPMLFRRMHSAAASAGLRLEDRQEHLDPRSVGKIHLELWRRAMEDGRSATRAPVALGVRARLLGVVLVSMAREWRVARWELTYWLRLALARFRPGSKLSKVGQRS